MSEATEKSPVIRLDAHDNVVVARVPIAKGTVLHPENIVVQSDIPLGHKLATCAIAKDEPVRKYNTIIGYATRDVVPGTHMHNDTIRFDRVEHPTDFCEDYHPVELLAPEQRRTFRGYVRPDGRVGTRNYIAIPVVSNCAATVARRIAAHFTPEALSAYPNVDGVVPLITTLGCGMEKGTALAMTYLRRVIAGHIRNPNMAGVLVCALGCENNNIDAFFEAEDFVEGPMLHKLTIQDMGAPEAVRRGIAIVEQMLPLANACTRSEVSVEHLNIGLQCGGSDAFSCASANPALGKAMDILVRNGGTACLSETTELFSAEGVLIRRAKSRETGERLLAALQWWLDYCKGKDMQINGKVTPGNNAGGLTNILEKQWAALKRAVARRSMRCMAMLNRSRSTVLSSWTRRPMTRYPRQHSSPAAAISVFLRPVAAPAMARDISQRSRSHPIRSCLPECRRIWTSTPVRSSTANGHWSRWARRFLSG